MYHPAGGLHEPKKMLLIRTDWVRLKRYLSGKLRIAQDKYTKPDYRILTTREELDEELSVENAGYMAIDTETMRGGSPFCLTFSCRPGSGYMILAGNKLLEYFNFICSVWPGRFLIHNALFDVRVLDQMGIRIGWDKIIDTMVRAYQLGNVPQGLKPLAYREMGMQMQDFTDLVSPYSTNRVLSYWREAYDLDWPKPEPQIIKGDNGDYKEYKPQSMKTKLKRFFTDYIKDPTRSVFDAWDNWEDSQKMIEEKMGYPYPGMCISHVPLPEIISYACKDADATIRLYSRLNYMSKRVRRYSQEYWGD
jgi:hypothetical protein